MSVYYVYILETRSKGGKVKYYTGYTKNLYNRINQHKKGRGAKFCRGKDLSLGYFESCFTQKEAMNRELEIKAFTHDQKKQLIEKFQKNC